MKPQDALRAMLHGAVDADFDRRYDNWQNREARAARAAIERQHPEARPDAATLRRVRDYAGDVLGSPRFAPWLETYTAWRRGFREGWMPDNFFGRVVLRAVPSTFGGKGDLGAKTLARRLLGTDLLPDRASWVHGQWLDAAGRPIGEAEALAAIFADDDVAILKMDGSSRGRGVVKIKQGEFRPAEHQGRGNFVVQGWIRQSAVLAAFASESVATVRVTTSKVDGAPATPRGAYLRLGLKGHDVVISGLGVRVAIVDGDGSLNAVAALGDWTSCEAHPDSGLSFAGARVPGYAAARAAVLALHDRLPHIAHVGWDLAIDRDGRPVLMEWNPGHAEIKFPEAATGPHFADMGWERLGRRGGSV